jgi:hypothetical protein
MLKKGGTYHTNRTAHPMLAPKSLPPSWDPARRMKMQATIFKIKVATRTSHS